MLTGLQPEDIKDPGTFQLLPLLISPPHRHYLAQGHQTVAKAPRATCDTIGLCKRGPSSPDSLLLAKKLFP